ncbi:MFS transporter [Actinomadura rudentiformis]|uniref:MFS transporter n=1 Tax=Actinomadura rudentiformis TaxID=359158 RepID=A0A6H9YXA4_9ACTN|nr:MFS transporter [Actinomadura rudentiformis]KAB2347072.1 MFS transporter [Actinomadura rudentiformis]
MFRSLRHHNYRLWAISDMVSVTGTWMQALALNWLILSITHSATSVGLGLVLNAAPALVLSPLAGALADRLPVRPIVLAAQVAQGGLAVLLAFIAVGDVQTTGGLYAISLASGVVGAFSGPALGRFGAEVVGPEDLSNALALGSVINSAGRILGMSLAGALIPLVGVSGVFMANAASFLAVIAAVLLMRRGELHVISPAAATERGIADGLRYVLRTPWLLVTFALAFVMGSLGRNYQVTMAAMSDGPLNAGAGGYGVLSVAFAIGTVLGGLYAAARARLPLRLLLAVSVAASVGQLLSGVSPSLVFFAIVMVPVAAAAVIIDTTVSTRAQLDSPSHLRGRVIAAQGMVGAAAGAVGPPALGALSDALGPRAALVLAGVVTTATALIAAYALIRIKRARVSVATTMDVNPVPVQAAAAPAASAAFPAMSGAPAVADSRVG